MSTYADNLPRPGRRFLLFTLVYIFLIPLVNWSFSWGVMVELSPALLPDWAFNPATVITGLVLVARDFAQREIGHWVLLAMAAALGLTAWLVGGELALASGLAFAISEIVDWLMFTFTRLRLSTRVLISSALAAPLDTTAFLFFAQSLVPGQFTLPNIVMSIVGKMTGALVIWWIVRRVERRRGGTAPRPASAGARPSWRDS